MKKRRLIFLIIGLILFLVPYLVNIYTINRLLSLIVGLVFILISLIINKKDKAWRIVFLPIIFLMLSFVIDYASSHFYKNPPIFAEEVKSSEDVSVYNSLFYRVYRCGKKYIVDDFYKKEYQCNEDSLNTIDSSSFLNNVLESYSEHKDKFVKIAGKVSKINGTYNLELQAYTLTDESINGYVLFSDNITLQVNFNKIEDLTKYKLYDSITVIGRIDELIKKGEHYIIKMIDSVILESSLYNDYELSVVEKNKCENDLEKYVEMNDITYSLSCISNIFVKYDSENVYDLSYVLSDKKVTLESLIEKSVDKEEEAGNIMYNLNDFKMLKCADNKKIILGNKSLKIDSPYCEVIPENTEDEL